VSQNKTKQKNHSWVWSLTRVIPATQELEVERLWPEASLGKNPKPYLKSKLNQKRLGAWLKWKRACPESIRL
jgi:hypothetical protein